jgi:glutaminase
MSNQPIGAEAIQELIEELHRRHRDNRGGAVADYIPELARAEADGFGIALATPEGRIYTVGDTAVPFTIQSISKPFVYGLALERLSDDHMNRKVGVEPSGEAFNAISLDPVSGIPRNPMINAGAIATTAQIRSHAGDDAERQLLAFFSGLAGRSLEVDPAVYISERDSGHRNRAISHLLRNAGVIEENPELGLDLYFRQCAIAVTCRDLAVMAATLACQGRQPISGATLISRDTAIRMLALMGSCGMYDYAGHWLHDVGMPAKSGVAGGVLAVVPGRLGLAVWSPRLDRYGNSVRGIAVCEEFSRRLGLHLYDQNPAQRNPIRRSADGRAMQSRRWRHSQDAERLMAAADRLKLMQVQGVLDFTACEQLLTSLQNELAGAAVLVLDLGRVGEVEESCLPLLQRQFERLCQEGLTLLLCRADGLPAGWEPQGSRRFASLDRALEAAEELVLERLRAGLGGSSAADPAAGLIESLEAGARAGLLPLLTIRRFEPGEMVMNRGERSDTLFIAREGLYDASLRLNADGMADSGSRLATFAPGMGFGEIGFLTGMPRTADVACRDGGSCWQLSRADYDTLRQQRPEVAFALVNAILSDLGSKLARASLQLSLLENS